uniref:outer membrane protein assembly factor BamB family protein n=1 Tax=Geitlerinema sp. PCC 9228 TaxID=111611 RepID=UPI00147B9DF4
MKIGIRFFVGTTVTAILLGGVVSGQMGGQQTAMFRANLQRTGVYPSGGPTERTQMVWKFETEYSVLSSPAVSGDVVYFGSVDENLYAVDINTGQELWSFETEYRVFSSPAVS